MLEHETLDYFQGEGLIARPIRPLRSGKEASVVLCEAGSALAGRRFVAIKQYRPIGERAFRADLSYMASDLSMLPSRDRRAIRTKTRHGREVQEGVWVHREWERLTTLHEAGCDVPEPIALGPRSICMQYLGDEAVAAPQLHRVRLDRATARIVFDRLLWNIETMLAHNLVHADLSPFNVLWWEDRAVLIDFPQAVDARAARDADTLLARDLGNLCRHFERYGVHRDPAEIAHGLWVSFLFADLHSGGAGGAGGAGRR